MRFSASHLGVCSVHAVFTMNIWCERCLWSQLWVARRINTYKEPHGHTVYHLENNTGITPHFTQLKIHSRFFWDFLSMHTVLHGFLVITAALYWLAVQHVGLYLKLHSKWLWVTVINNQLADEYVWLVYLDLRIVLVDIFRVCAFGLS